MVLFLVLVGCEEFVGILNLGIVDVFVIWLWFDWCVLLKNLFNVLVGFEFIMGVIFFNLNVL